VWLLARRGAVILGGMGYTDPLDAWLDAYHARAAPRVAAERLAEAQAALKALPALLQAGQLMNSRLAGLGWRHPGVLPQKDVRQAERLYRDVYAMGGNGTTYVQAGLLNLIGASAQPASLPFWAELLSVARPRDTFARRRRTFALAAMAYLAIGNSSQAAAQEAEDRLRQAAHHASPDVRAEAILRWGQVYQTTERPLPEAVAAALRSIAVDDGAFSPRFQARAVLRAFDLPVPHDNLGGVYALKVKFQWAKSIYRTIEVRSEQTLDDLQRAIQHAIDWDNDHLYSFFMNGDEDDDRYRYSCPMESDSPPWTSDAVLGELGLVRRHKFLYYFDYGDSHRFEVEVVDIRPADQVKRGERYPRVVASHSEAPEQYPHYDE
jgi:plasmid stability protein